MTCDEARILLHALIDGELDAGHAREVEDHIAGCAACAGGASSARAVRPKKRVAERVQRGALKFGRTRRARTLDRLSAVRDR